jgi:hypothetical protein
LEQNVSAFTKKNTDTKHNVQTMTVPLTESNSILEHYKTIDEMKTGLTSYIPEEVIK